MNNGSHGEVLRVRKGGVLSRHRHPSPVHGFVLKGSWRYREHTWTATAGRYVFEPPGEVHASVDDDCPEMQTMFVTSAGRCCTSTTTTKSVHVEDNVGLIELCRTTYEASGLGADYVDQFIR